MEKNAGPAIRSVAVIGAGERGRGFALRCAQAGFAVILEDVMPSKLRRAEEELAAEPGDLQSRVQLAITVEDAVRDADLAIDFVPDELESKLEIFSLLDRMAPPKTILCTPTEVLSITDLASCTYRAAQCVALGSDALSGPVELVRGRTTSAGTVERVAAWLTAIGLTPMLVEDSRDSLLVSNPNKSA